MFGLLSVLEFETDKGTGTYWGIQVHLVNAEIYSALYNKSTWVPKGTLCCIQVHLVNSVIYIQMATKVEVVLLQDLKKYDCLVDIFNYQSAWPVSQKVNFRH